MIRTLELKKYGRFINQSFKLKDMTVFYGKNEAGKTTIFDSIYTSLFKMGGASADQKKFNKRYGTEAESRVLDDNGHGVKQDLINFDEFRTLYAIRAGDVSLELKEGSKNKEDWLGEMKANLLSGGIDFAKIQKEFNNITAENGVLKINKDLKKLELKRDELIKDLIEAKAKREEHLRSEEHLKSEESNLDELRQSIKQKEDSLAEISNNLIRENKIREKIQFKKILFQFNELHKKEANLLANKLYANNRVSAFDLMAKEETEFISVIEYSKKEILQLQKEIAVLKDKAKEQKEALAKIEKKRNFAKELKLRIDNFLENLAKSKTEIIDSVSLAMAAIFALTGIVAGIIGYLEDWKIYVILLIVVLSFGFVGYFLKKIKNQAPDKSDDEFGKHRSEWKLGTGESLEDFSNLYTLRDYYAKVENESLALEDSFKATNEFLSRKQIDLEEKNSALTLNERKLSELLIKMNEWLQQFKVQNRDEYLEKVNEYKINKLALDQFKSSEEGKKFTEELKLEIERKLKNLDEDNVPDIGLNENEYKILEGKKVALEKELFLFKDILAVKDKTQGEQKGKLSGISESVLESILKDEREKIKIQKEIDEIYLKKEGAKLAENILMHINEDMNRVLLDLSTEISEEISTILGTRKVEIEKLHHDNFKLEDATGNMLDVDLLSNGTRDIFLFILKLAFIRKNNRNLKLLLLDEPFLALDRERQIKCLNYLKVFKEKTGFQIIFLTKEQGLKEDIEHVFIDVQLNELSA